MDMNSGGMISPLGGRTGHTHTAEDANAIPKALITAPGDLVVGDDNAEPTTLTRGPDGHALVSDDTADLGVGYREVSLPGHEHPYSPLDHGHIGSVPIGGVVPFAGSTPPSGWLLCNGAEVSETEYPDLAVVCGTAYGTASQSGFFKLPSLVGRFVMGVSPGVNNLASTGGANSVTLSESQLPAHTHAGPSHSHETSFHSHTIAEHNHTIPEHGHGVSVTVTAESAHTHAAGALDVVGQGKHTHGGTSSTQVVRNVSFVDASNTSESGGGARIKSASLNRDFVAIDVPESGTHAHQISGDTGSGSSHTHSVSATVDSSPAGVTGGATASTDSVQVSVLAGGDTVNTGSTGGGMPVETRPAFLALNFLIRAR